MTRERLRKMQESTKWKELSGNTQKLIEASSLYYIEGEFPAASLVNLGDLPQLVTGRILGGGRA